MFDIISYASYEIETGYNKGYNKGPFCQKIICPSKIQLKQSECGGINDHEIKETMECERVEFKELDEGQVKVKQYFLN